MTRIHLVHSYRSFPFSDRIYPLSCCPATGPEPGPTSYFSPCI